MAVVMVISPPSGNISFKHFLIYSLSISVAFQATPGGKWILSSRGYFLYLFYLFEQPVMRICHILRV